MEVFYFLLKARPESGFLIKLLALPSFLSNTIESVIVRQCGGCGGDKKEKLDRSGEVDRVTLMSLLAAVWQNTRDFSELTEKS